MSKRSTKRAVAIAVGAAAAATCVLAVAPASAGAASGSVWDRVANCESSGNWHIHNGNGYYGGLQFSSGTWSAYGGHTYAGQASSASREQQILIAQRVLSAQGPNAWPVCGPRAGLNRSNGTVPVAHTGRWVSRDAVTSQVVTTPHAHFVSRG